MIPEDVQSRRQLESSDPIIRQQAAHNLLSQRLNNFERIDKGREIDLEYVSNAEYQLFLDDLEMSNNLKQWYELVLDNNKQSYQPGHWLKNTFAQGQALLPVTGVRADAALAFCEWLNQKDIAKNSHYTLPHSVEAIQHPASTFEIATWCIDKNKFTLSGLNDQTNTLILGQLKDFTGIALPQSVTQYFSEDRCSIIEYNFGFNKDHRSWDYQKIRISHLRDALQPVLGLFFGNPGRDLLVATSYNIAHAQAIANAYSLAQILDLSEDFTKYQTGVLYNNFDLAGFKNINTAVKSADLELAQRLTKELGLSQNRIEVRWAHLLEDFLAIIKAQSIIELRGAYRQYTAHLAKYAFIGYSILNVLENEAEELIRPLSKVYRQGQLANLPDNNFLRSAFNKIGNYVTEQEVMLILYLQMQIFMAREADQLISWEGIRLVRESVNV